MLGLTRKQSESVVIIQGGKVVATLTIKDIKRGSVRIGFDAKSDVRIMRSELLEKEPQR